MKEGRSRQSRQSSGRQREGQEGRSSVGFAREQKLMSLEPRL